mmetsp:Transcript_41501/g.115379  ORF Transcript_41501/g.115379 Transcript_41501/m.115379 type:complete len:401 (-) Transcript_41501:523-1725(-)
MCCRLRGSPDAEAGDGPTHIEPGSKEIQRHVHRRFLGPTEILDCLVARHAEDLQRGLGGDVPPQGELGQHPDAGRALAPLRRGRALFRRAPRGLSSGGGSGGRRQRAPARELPHPGQRRGRRAPRGAVERRSSHGGGAGDGSSRGHLRAAARKLADPAGNDGHRACRDCSGGGNAGAAACHGLGPGGGSVGRLLGPPALGFASQGRRRGHRTRRSAAGRGRSRSGGAGAAVRLRRAPTGVAALHVLPSVPHNHNAGTIPSTSGHVRPGVGARATGLHCGSSTCDGAARAAGHCRADAAASGVRRLRPLSLQHGHRTGRPRWRLHGCGCGAGGASAYAGARSGAGAGTAHHALVPPGGSDQCRDACSGAKGSDQRHDACSGTKWSGAGGHHCHAPQHPAAV